MSDQYPILITIGVMSSIVYTTRLSGYLIGLRVRHIEWLKPILEALPGCAFMALLVPAVRRGDLVELAAMICVVGIMWKTDNVVIASITGMSVLLLGQTVISG